MKWIYRKRKEPLRLKESGGWFGVDYNELLSINNINKLRVSNIGRLLRDPKVLVPSKDLYSDKAEVIFNLLTDSAIRRGDGIIYYDVQKEYKKKINKFISRNEPISFVFQGLPFKCHNPVETLRRTPDLGELATLQRLLDINETIKQIYPLGVEFTILTESSSYIELFGASQNEADVYLEQCKHFSEVIHAGSVIKFVDLLDLVGDKKKFFELCKAKEVDITNMEVEQFTPVMMRSMPIIEQVAFDDLLAIFGYGANSKNLTDFEKEFAKYIKVGAIDLAIKYLAIQKTKSQFNVVNSNFPDSLYVSTTAKQDKYSFHPIHKKTRLYAHHGVPVLGSDKVDIVYLGEVLTNPQIYTAVYVDGDIEDAPFYFLKGKQHIKKLV